MAQTIDAKTGQKRGPGRPPKAAQPALKKTRLSSTVQSPLDSPSAQSPAPETKLSKLPHKISDLRPLPTLTEAQAPSLSADEYQSIAASAVLQASLDRSRLAWIHDGVFERYWTKPDSGKNAKPPPKNNPDLKWMKHRGPCRIRIEPHIFEAEMYVEEKPRPPPPPAPKQYAQGFGQPYRPPQQQQYGGQQQYYNHQNQNQSRTLPPPQPQNTLPPLSNSPAPQPQQQRSTPAPQGQEKKASPDPVISMLATRASSDPELKSLMKEVATGNATQEQLKVFQGHIDELTKIINEKKKKEGESASPAPKPEQSEIIQYDGPSEVPPPAPVQQQTARPPYQPPQPQQPVYQPQHTWQPPPPPPPAPTNLPVILQFTTPGATDDRFLFPQHSILESLSPQHLLASFLVTRQASSLPSTTVSELSLDVSKEYYQPITLMVEVAYNREHLLELVKRWVKPAEEVKKFMEETMARCERAADVHLALRLPFKGSALAADADEVSALEAVALAEREAQRIGEKRGQGKTVKYVKKASLSAAGSGASTPVGKKEDPKGPASAVDAGKQFVNGATAATATPAQVNGASEGAKEDNTAPTSAPVAGEATGEKKEGEDQGATESGRPRRTTRKSVRISEG